MRPLYFDGPRLYCSRFNKIYVTEDLGKNFAFVGSLAVEGFKTRLFGLHPLLQRLSRANVYRMRVMSDGTMIFLFLGGVYTMKPGAQVGEKTFSVTRGSRPVSLATKPDGLTVFGDYWINRGREEVHIYGSTDYGNTWDVVHTFPAGCIRHVHGISYDPWDECFWICSGDADEESGLFRASADFDDVRAVRKGCQTSRFYSILVRKDILLMATDTPLQENHVCVFDKKRETVREVQRIENSSFYGCTVGRDVFFSTNAEPSPVNDTGASHVWMGNLNDMRSWQHVLALRVDLLDRISHPPGIPEDLFIFQLPRVFFAEGENSSDVLVCHGVGLQGFDDAMLCYDIAKWRSGS